MKQILRSTVDSLFWIGLGMLAAVFGWRIADRIREAWEGER